MTITGSAQLAASKMQLQLVQARKRNAVAGRVAELQLQAIEPRLLELEPLLSESCWYAYGFLSPFQRAELFTQTYFEAFATFTAKYYDVTAAPHVRPVNPKFLKNTPRVRSSLWSARQCADELGIPYDLFLNRIMEIAVQEIGHKKLPTPNQLCKQAILDELTKYWKQHSSVQRLFTDGWDRQFFAMSARQLDTPARSRAVQALFSANAGKSDEGKAMTLAGHLKSGAVALEEVRECFGDGVALAASEGIPIPKREPVPDPALPGCLGYIGPVAAVPASTKAAVCQTCRYAAPCERVKALVDAELTKNGGSGSVWLDSKRAAARARQRRFREKRRAFLAGHPDQASPVSDMSTRGEVVPPGRSLS